MARNRRTEGRAPEGPHPTEPTALTGGQRDVLAALRTFGVPATVDDLATRLGQHPNTTREHLDALCGAGRATRLAGSSRGRGRPAYRYRAVPGAGDMAGLYVGLVSVLAEQLSRTSPDPVQAAVQAGRALSGTVDPGPTGPGPHHSTAAAARRQVVADLATLGFAPQADARNTVVRLRACPVLESARQNPGIVCAVHEGLVERLMERSGGDPRQVALVPFAGPGWCRLGLGPGA